VATARIGVIVVSDRASRGEYADEGGPAAREYLEQRITSPVEVKVRLVPDERPAIEAALCEMADAGFALVVTTGGTGPAPRDVTPEATEAVCDRMLPGFGEAMRAVSLRSVPTAVLSRQTAGHRGGCLIVNLPGRPGAIAECLDAVWGAIPYGIELAGGPRIEAEGAFRPRGR
jgi:molybdopterin adenylyltransferase